MLYKTESAPETNLDLSIVESGSFNTIDEQTSGTGPHGIIRNEFLWIEIGMPRL